MSPNIDDTDPAIINTELPKLCTLLYGIFLASIVLQFLNIYCIVLGSVAVTAGVILAYLERRKATGTVYANHLHWLIRTFWIGGSIYLPIVTVLGSIVVLFVTDSTGIQQEVANPAPDLTSQVLVQHFVAYKDNASIMQHVMFAFLLPFAIWWVWRCGYGYKRLSEGKPIPNVMSWF
ncbi:MAG: hypothetical protein PW788_00160 [Micavibrio sp.]|nr:hypothetical protein [Micavibrio sp.]